MLFNTVLFTGNANPALAQEIAGHLGIELGKAKVGRFSDGEVDIEIEQNVRARDIFVVQPTCAPTNENLMELCILVDALKRASARRITAVVPYFGYARQDRRPRSTRVPISAKVVANMLQSVGVERLLAEVVDPWRRQGGALLIVLDGMSSAIATALAPEVSRLGLVEWVPEATQARMPVAAALPSLTNISRTSLFCGEVCSGSGDDEKRGLATAFPGAKLFHKNDLRSEGGASLPAEVTAAIRDTATRVVGVVINAIDDATHKNDTSAWEWNLRSLDPLRALLEAAISARRAVILTSDHGHIVERDTEALSASGAESRWRPAAAGARWRAVRVRSRMNGRLQPPPGSVGGRWASN
mgnify:CR=1 FL=1